MLSYILQRLLQIPFTLLLVSLVVFIIVRTTGYPAQIYLGLESTPEQVTALREKLGLNRPLAIQYLHFLRDILQGNFGESLRFQAPALPLVLQRLGATLQLAITGVSLACLVGMLAGIVCALKKDSPLDFLLSGFAVIGQSVPSFWLGIMLISFFAVTLRWLPTSGTGSWRHLVLPALTLSAFLLPQFVLLTRISILEVLQEQFVVTANAKGLSERKVLFKHVLKNALNPVVTFLGMEVGRLVGGSIITETIFAWPGVGRLAVTSIFQRDVPVVEAAVFVISIGIIVSNLCVDVVLSLIDPRIKLK